MIIFENVTKKYGSNVYAVRDLDLNIEAGEFVSIVGQSGTGKTTLVKLMTAEEQADKGKIVIGGWDITRVPPADIPYLRRQIGVIFQDFRLLPKKTIWENISFALEVCGATSKRIHAIIPQILKIVGLDKKENRYPNQLSGGEQQRVAIARALSHRPKILLADEPTGNLDSFNTREIIDLLLKINEFGTTVVLVTHNREVVNFLKKRVITLEDGTIISDQKKGKYLI